MFWIYTIALFSFPEKEGMTQNVIWEHHVRAADNAEKFKLNDIIWHENQRTEKVREQGGDLVNDSIDKDVICYL